MNATNTNRYRTVSLVALALVTAVLCAPRVNAQSYTPTDIQAPDGGSFWPSALNDHGEVVGSYLPPDGSELPAVWRDGEMTLLPLSPGAVSGWVGGLNNSGQMVGACSTRLSDGSLVPQACLWENGTVRALPWVDGAHQSGAWAINDAGTVAGNVFGPSASGGDHWEVVVWKGSTAIRLSPPTAGADTWAGAIDGSGRVAVSWTDSGDGIWHPARWTPSVSNGTSGTMTTLAQSGFAHDINDGGVISGDMGFEPALWDGSTMITLGNLFWGDAVWGSAIGINNAGAVVGYSSEDFVSVAWVWDAQSGMWDLNLLLNSSTAYAYPGSLAQGLAINGSGQILVSTDMGNYVLLTPSSLPQAPLPPGSLFSAAGDGWVQLGWYSAWHASSYNVKRFTVSGGPYTTIATGVSDAGYLDQSVVNGTRYYYVVSSVDGAYESADSPEATARPLATPVAPTGLTATAPQGARGGVNLAWKQSPSPEIGSNRIYRSTKGGAYELIAQVSTGTSYLDKAVRHSVTYSYAVTAVNSNGQESPSSNVATVRPK